MKQTLLRITAVGCLLGCILMVSCTKERFSLFSDKGCIYTGVLEVQRPTLSGFTLHTLRFESKGESVDTPRVWDDGEESKSVPIGLYLAVYGDEQSMKHVSWKSGTLEPLPFETSTATGYGDKIMMGCSHGEVVYEDTLVLLAQPKALTQAVHTQIVNNSSRVLSDLRIDVSKALVCYDLWNDKPTVERVISLVKEPLVFAKGDEHSLTNYIPSLEPHAAALVTFKDQDDVRYTLSFKQAYRHDNEGYHAVIELTDSLMEAHGAIATRVRYVPSLAKVVLDGVGGRQSVSLTVSKVVIKSRGGKEVSREEIPCSWTAVLEPENTDIRMEQVTEGLLFVVTPNNSPSDRVATVVVTVEGESIRIPLVQLPNGLHNVEGEIV